MQPIQLRKCNQWKGEYRGVLISILQHGEDQGFPHGVWCGYLHLTSEKNPEIKDLRGKSNPLEFAGRVRDRMDHHKFFDTLHFHGGVTFYEETLTLGGTIRIKIGMDYAHTYDCDDGSIYPGEKDEADVLGDLCEIVDRYREVYPEKESK